MKPNETLTDFIRDGLRAGHTPPELRGALKRAGWPGAEIDAALAGWADGGLRLAVPRPRPATSGREMVVFGLFAITLVVVIWHLVQLAFALIDLWLPDPQFPNHGWAHGSIRWSVAVLVVVLPLFAWLTWRVDRPARKRAEGPRAPLQRRFGALAVLVSVLVLIGNGVSVVYAALNGDLTQAFLAKAVVVAAVAALLIAWFRSDARGA